MDGTVRSNIKIGTKVQVVQKQDQRTGKLTEGVVIVRRQNVGGTNRTLF